MKNILLILLLLPFSIIAQNVQEFVKFDTEIIDLGVVKKGDQVTNEFVFTNMSTCECTEAKWTQGKIKPGEKGKITFVFDSTKKELEESVDVDVYFINTDPITGNPYSIFLSYVYQWNK